MDTSVLVLLCLIMFGILFLAVGTGIGMGQKKKKKRCTDPVNATVIENRRRTMHSMEGYTSETFSPVFQYYYNGRDYTTESNHSSNPPAFSVGEETEIFVDPKSPQKIYIPNEKTTKILSLVFKLVGVVTIIFGFVIYELIK